MYWNKAFWHAMDQLVSSTKIVIDRPRGSAHPKFKDFIYPVNYGYLEGTSLLWMPAALTCRWAQTLQEG